MSVSLTPIITTAGLQAVLNATNDGVQARITHVALGDTGWEPTNAATALINERNRVTVSNGERTQPTQIHITAIENGTTEYWVREIGFMLDDGTLLAIWSHPTQALAWKASDVDLLLAFDMLLSALPADSVVVDGTGGVNLAPATQSHEGVVRLATTAEAQAGTLDGAIAMTPATNRTHGDTRYARVSHRHPWSDLDEVPSMFPPAGHSHTWLSVTDKPSTFPPEAHGHAFQGAVSKAANHVTLAASTITTIYFPTRVYDTDGIRRDNAIFEVPDGASKIRVAAQAYLNGSAGWYALYVYKNGELWWEAGQDVQPGHQGSSLNNRLTITSGVLPANPGDDITFRVVSTTLVNMLTDGTWGSLEVVE
jgi:Phage tail-collar fibre protein